VNTLALAYASFHILWEAIERLYDPPDVKTENLLTVSVLGLLINLIGIFAFEHGGHGHSHGGGDGGHGHSHSHGSHGHSHSHGEHDECGDDDTGACPAPNNRTTDKGAGQRGTSSRVIAVHPTAGSRKNPLMQGMFLHVLADTMGSVAVIVSALLIKNFGWHWTDPLSSLILSILIFGSIYPVLKDTACILLQRCPPNIEKELPAAFQKVRALVASSVTNRGDS